MNISPWMYLVAVPIFALLVLVHELGHFLTAKWAGIRVDEFAIGFPPRLARVTRGETTYSINLLPIGGYVRMPGENGETTDEHGNPDPRTFGAKPAGKRAIVLVAGVTMNVILAIVLFTLAEAIGQVTPSSYVTVESGSPAQAAGIHTGDHVVAIDGTAVKTFDDLIKATTDAINAGVKADPKAKTVAIPVTVQRAGSPQSVVLTVNANVSGTAHLGVSTDPAHGITTPHPLWEAPGRGVQDIGSFFQSIYQLIRGQIPFQLSGPVGIVQQTGQIAATVPIVGWYWLIYLAGLLSLNLAVVNLLPVPGLDGGRLLLIGIEVLRRGKRLTPEREALVNLIGMGALLFLVLIVTFHDVGNLFQ
jgi:regulator of sigma E protease